MLDLRDDRAALALALRARVREIPDFPTTGIGFKDITPVLGDAALFAAAMRALAEAFRDEAITHVAAIESRGFLLAAPVAMGLGAGIIPIRKVGKLPFRTERIDYALEYGSATLEVHVDACPPGSRVLVVDDVLATGGTALAACALLERLGAEVVGLAFLLSLGFLPGVERLAGRRLESLVDY
jgi:adenine phosphoribosyltransferase